MPAGITMLVAEMISDLNVKSAFEHGLGHLDQQPVRPVDGGPGFFGVVQQRIYRCRRQQLPQLRGGIVSRRVRLWQLKTPVRWSTKPWHHHSGQTPYTVNETRPSEVSADIAAGQPRPVANLDGQPER